MKTLVTLLMLSMATPAAFAQSNCEKLRNQERKISQIEKKINEQQNAVAELLRSIKSKSFRVDGSKIMLSLGASTAIGGIIYSIQNRNNMQIPVILGAAIVSAGSLYYLSIESKDLHQLYESLEKKQNELDSQNEAIENAKSKLDDLISLYPSCL